MKKVVYIITPVLILVGFGVWWNIVRKETPTPLPVVTITNFEECAKAGNPIMESNPRQCSSGGKTFVESVKNESDINNLIRVTTPKPNQIISSPLIIEGEARGTWFFEASFPVVLTNWDGLIIAQGIATAEGNWMTENFVPFKAKLEFKNPSYKNNGTLILRRDNPSGLSQNDRAIEIPIIYQKIDNSVVVSTSTVMKYNSGVNGRVSLGPTCPVMRNPPDPDCADRSYQTTVQVIEVGSSKSSPFATIKTDKDGYYTVMLPPGKYALQPVGGSPLPRCSTENVSVEKGKISVVNISCDTGIR